jgi:hypothetical protein
MCIEIFSKGAGPAWKLHISISRLFYEIRQIEMCRGQTEYKFTADAGFKCDKDPTTNAVLREKIKDIALYIPLGEGGL